MAAGYYDAEKDRDKDLLKKLQMRMQEQEGQSAAGQDAALAYGQGQLTKALSKRAAKTATTEVAKSAATEAAKNAVKDTAKEASKSAAGSVAGTAAGGLSLATEGAGKQILSGKKVTGDAAFDTAATALATFGGPAGMAAGTAMKLGKGLFAKKKAKKLAGKMKEKAAEMRGKAGAQITAKEVKQREALKDAERKKLLGGL